MERSDIRLWRTARSCKSKIPSIGNELGLGWYDYGARMYSPTVGRWNGVDALAEDYLAWSPFNYTLDNPINLIDPDGNPDPSDAVPQKWIGYGVTALVAGTIILMAEGDDVIDYPYAHPLDDVEENEDGYVLLYRAVDEAEKMSIESLGYNFSILENGFLGKQCWLFPQGLSDWQNSILRGQYEVTALVPKSVLGPEGSGAIAEYIFTDRNHAVTVYPQNLPAFNAAKVILSITEAK